MRAIGQKLSSAFCNFELRPQKYTLHSISAYDAEMWESVEGNHVGKFIWTTS